MRCGTDARRVAVAALGALFPLIVDWLLVAVQRRKQRQQRTTSGQQVEESTQNRNWRDCRHGECAAPDPAA
jgi:hypothetical protein